MLKLKNILLQTVIVLTLIILPQACTNHETDPRLTEAEQMMEQAPDSALLILESMSQKDLKNEGDRALYGMLYTQALDKNHLPLQNDTIISASADYYAKKSDKLNQVVSTYYLGRTYYNKGNYTKAIVSFFKARELAKDNGYDFWAGMACRGISDIYNQTYNRAEELSFRNEEYDYIKKSGKQPYLNWALLDLCNSTYNYRDIDKSDSLSLQLLDSAKKYDDRYLLIESLRIRMMTLIDKNQYDLAHPLVLEICKSELAESSDSLHLCEILIEMGNVSEAQKILGRISETEEDKLLKSFIRYSIAKRFGDHESALEEVEYIDGESNTIIKNAVSQNLTSPLTDYFDLRKKLDESEIKVYRIKFLSIVICSIVVLILILVIGFYLYKRHRRNISEKILLAQQLQEDLKRAYTENILHSEMIKNLNAEKQDLQQQLKVDSVRSADRDAELHNIIKDLLSSQYELFEELSSISLTSLDSKTAEKKIVAAVTRFIKDLSTPNGKIVDLEKQVNSIYGNLISDFKKDLPNMKDADYMLFLFSVYNFSSTTIMLLLKEDKISAVYNRKKRLKEKIRQLDDAKRDRYLEFLM